MLFRSGESEKQITDKIKDGLSGNVCRCTGYKKIVEAVAEYTNEVCGSKTEVNSFNTNQLSKNAQPFSTEYEQTAKNIELKTKTVGIGRPYIEATKKVQGLADYADDYKIKNALHVKFLRSIYPHAKIENIDTSEAEKISGVRYIAIGKELPVTFGVLPISQDETAMAIDKVRFTGEIVAAVAADTEAIASEACKLIKVKYNPLKEFLTIEDSIKDIQSSSSKTSEPVIEKIHPEYGKLNNNIHKKAELRFGDQQKGLEESEVVSKMDFEMEGVNHGFTEPHATIAYWDENGLTMISATQVTHYLQRALAKTMEVPLSRVRVIKPYIGGGFGGKGDPFAHEIIVAHLSRKTRKPCRVKIGRAHV